MTLNEYLAHYDALCEELFSAETYRTRPRLEEVEFVLKHVYGRTEEQINQRYLSNYRVFFSPVVEQVRGNRHDTN